MLMFNFSTVSVVNVRFYVISIISYLGEIFFYNQSNIELLPGIENEGVNKTIIRGKNVL